MVEIKNYCLILSRSKNKYCESFTNTISNSVVIYDKDISDEELKNQNYCCLTENVKKNSAWDKAIYYIDSNLNLLKKYDYFYFIEDDVYSNNLKIFIDLFTILDNYNHDLIAHNIKTQQQSPEWSWWKKYRKYTVKSYNPLCRLSTKMIRLIIDYHKKNKKLLFHEILFASLAYSNKLSVLDLRSINQYKNLFGIFRYRPVIDTKNIRDNKIYHPVKPKYEKI